MVLAACLGEGPVRRRHLSTLGDRPRAKQPNRNQLDDHGGRHIRGGTPLLIISVRAVTRVDHRRAAGLTVGVAVDLDVQRLPQDYFRLSTLVTVMITARVTRVWLCQRPPVAAQSPLLDSSYLSYQLRRAAPGRCQARRASRATPRMIRWRPGDGR